MPPEPFRAAGFYRPRHGKVCRVVRIIAVVIELGQ